MKKIKNFLGVFIFICLFVFNVSNVYAGLNIPTEGIITDPVTDLGKFNLSINYGITKSQGLKIELQNYGYTVGSVKLGGYNSGLFTLESYDASTDPITFKIKSNTTIPVGVYYLDLTWTEKQTGVDNNGNTWIRQKLYKASIEVTINKVPVTFTSSIEDNQLFYYDGQIKKPIGSVTVQNNQAAQNTLTATYKGMGTTNYNSTTPPTKVGIYTVTYTVSNNYEATPLSYAFMITKGDPTYDIPTDLQGKKGQKLSNITLPTGFTWNNPNTELALGKHTYKATYTPTDTKNYRIIKDINIEVNTKEFVSLTTSVNGTGGTISSSISNISANTKKTITFTPNTGFMIDKVLVNNIETLVTNNKLELTMNEDKNVVVTYKKIPFTITVKETNNATIIPNGVINVNYGDNQDFVISASRGYKIVKVLVDGQSKELVDGTLTISNITKNLEVEVIVEKKVYNGLEGLNQTYTISKNKKLRFRIDADYSLFNGLVYVDGKLVDRNNYTSESGSTIIVLKQSYLDTLKAGEHTFKVEFSDGAEFETKFIVAQLEKQKENPKTFDNIGTSLLIGSISLIGLIGTTIYLKKRSNIKVN